MKAPTRQELVELTGDDELLFADGFDAAILGIATRCSKPAVVVYDKNKCIEILIEEENLEYEQAIEHFDFNVSGGWVGERTPLFLCRPDEE